MLSSVHGTRNVGPLTDPELCSQVKALPRLRVTHAHALRKATTRDAPSVQQA